ncbi:hypothetical protein JNUCC0626_20950 [Lentzea sp. JNUCC 0626]|uniref:hypothetical protein n=1 Tax=Lentzea sp. JNUCC 0626 TaxID=3367513 RepID=UPI003747DAF5
MALNGVPWAALPLALHLPGTEIRRQDHGGMAVCHIELAAGTHTAPVFADLPGDHCALPHWGHVIAGRIRVHGSEHTQDFGPGESCYWAPGHNLEALTDVEYVEITPAEAYDELMEHAAGSRQDPAQAGGATHD